MQTARVSKNAADSALQQLQSCMLTSGQPTCPDMLSTMRHQQSVGVQACSSSHNNVKAENCQVQVTHCAVTTLSTATEPRCHQVLLQSMVMFITAVSLDAHG